MDKDVLYVIFMVCETIWLFTIESKLRRHDVVIEAISKFAEDVSINMTKVINWIKVIENDIPKGNSNIRGK